MDRFKCDIILQLQRFSFEGHCKYEETDQKEKLDLTYNM